MELRAFQQQVDTWIKTHGVRYFDEKTNTLLLMEEVGELSRLIARKYGEQSFKDSKNEEIVDQQIADELADILFVLCCLANQMGYDLTEMISANFAKKNQRDQLRHKSNSKLTSQ